MGRKQPNKEHDHLWYQFCEFAEIIGISLEHADDYLPQWEVFVAGARAERARENHELMSSYELLAEVSNWPEQPEIEED